MPRVIPFLILAFLGPALGACSDQEAPTRRVPTRGQPLASRLALVILDGIGDEAFAETTMMANVEDGAARGARGDLQSKTLDFVFDPSQPEFMLPQLIGPAGLRAVSFGQDLDFEGWTNLQTSGANAFDQALFDRLDDDRWHFLLARLVPESLPTEGPELFETGTRRPSARGFALAALDHELRRLVLQVGSHLSLLVIRRGAVRYDWTISGPGSDDPLVLETLRAGKIGRALALLLGFQLD